MLDPDSKPFFFFSPFFSFSQNVSLEQKWEIAESLEMSVLEHFAEHAVWGHKHTIQL